MFLVYGWIRSKKKIHGHICGCLCYYFNNWYFSCSITIHSNYVRSLFAILLAMNPSAKGSVISHLKESISWTFKIRSGHLISFMAHVSVNVYYHTFWMMKNCDAWSDASRSDHWLDGRVIIKCIAVIREQFQSILGVLARNLCKTTFALFWMDLISSQNDVLTVLCSCNSSPCQIQYTRI